MLSVRHWRERERCAGNEEARCAGLYPAMKRNDAVRDECDFSRGKRGAVIASPGKTSVTLMLDDDVIEAFRARAESAGTGYQTLINSALRDALAGAKGRSNT